MIAHTQAQLDALKAGPVVSYLIKFDIGNTTYRLTTQDHVVNYSVHTYTPGFNVSVDRIEITSMPRTNDIKIELIDVNKTIVTELLSNAWMNKDCEILKLFQKPDGEVILVKSAFEGSLTDFEISEKDSKVELTMTSVWADFEKEAGIKTNLKSQQRFYPNDTAGRHASEAIKKVYWGKDAPRSTMTYNGGNGGGYNEPQERIFKE